MAGAVGFEPLLISKRGLSQIHDVRGHSPWLGSEYLFQTFKDDIEVNVEEIRQLFGMDGDCGENEK